MKAKISRGGGFRGALDYVFDEGKDATGNKNAERVGGNMSGADPRALAREFSAVRKLRPDISKPVWHCSLSLPPGDKLSSDKWNAVASDFMRLMGFSDVTPWVAVRHSDTEKDHIHIIASRVDLSGAVWLGQWEARRAIEATQQLERIHGLTLTAGLGEARAERKRLTSQEINMAVRTGEEPPRQKLQRLVDEAMKDQPTAVEFAERLTAAGVGVRANIASTGRMNGFSFEIDGVPFKASDLGAAYKWRALQKVVSYDEVRDRAILEQYRTPIADRAEHQGVAGESEQLAVLNSSGNGAGLGASDGAAEEHRHIDSSAAPVHRRADARDAAPVGAGLEASGAADEAVGSDATDTEPSSVESDERQERNSAGLGADRRSVTDAVSESESLAPVASGRGGGRSCGGDWAIRFKQASAAKRRAAEGGVGAGVVGECLAARASVDSADRQSARTLDPTPYLETHGYTVRREGKHRSVRLHGDEVYRITQKSDGRWLWCDLYGNEGGDNIDLVRELEPGTSFVDATFKLLGSPVVNLQPRPAPHSLRFPRLPRYDARDVEIGRFYLRSRGIDDQTIEAAEKAGMLAYCADGVLFVGRDTTSTPRNVTRRATSSADPIQKRDFAGSDKRFPPIFWGDHTQVLIVEGGVSALAAHTMARRMRRPAPTVIVSGGAHVRSFLETPHIQELLRQAQQIVVACEHEKDAETQQRTDDAHKEQARRIEEITGRAAQLWWPSLPAKDIADLNMLQARSQQAQHEQQQGGMTPQAPQM